MVGRVNPEREVVLGDDDVELNRGRRVALLIGGVQDEQEDLGCGDFLGHDAVEGYSVIDGVDPVEQSGAIFLTNGIEEFVVGGEGLVVEVDAERPSWGNTEGGVAVVQR